MKHLQEEELVAHFYGEGEEQAAEHLDACAVCAERYDALRRDLEEIQPIGVPVRAESYGQDLWRRLTPSLPAYRAAGRSWWRVYSWPTPWRNLGYAAACLLLLAAAFSAGRLWEHRKPQITAAANSAPQVKQRVVLVLMGDHLDRSERLLVELKHADPDSQETLAPLRDEARTLLAANHICQKESEAKSDPQLATALDHLNQLLDEIANRPQGLNAENLARLQQEMNADGLLFEVRVLRSRVQNQNQSQPESQIESGNASTRRGTI